MAISELIKNEANLPPVPPREAKIVTQALAEGIVPNVGARQIAAGRKDEITSAVNDLETAEQGASSMRAVIGRFGAGKSFFFQLVKVNALDRGFVVLSADFAVGRHLSGASGQGQSLYRELMSHISTKNRPDGKALASIFERWLTDLETVTPKEKMNDAISHNLKGLTELAHGYDFVNILRKYYEGHVLAGTIGEGEEAVNLREKGEKLMENSLRWVRGEYTSRLDAKADLGVRAIPGTDDWYDYLKLFSAFSRTIGYKGSVVLFDELINLWKITTRVSREQNYEKILTIYNDLHQGNVEGMVMYLAGTEESVYDERRGLFSYAALKTRLAPSSFGNTRFAHQKGPLLTLRALTDEEKAAALYLVERCHKIANPARTERATEKHIEVFMNALHNRLGASQYLEVRDLLKGWVDALDAWAGHPEEKFEAILSEIAAAVELTAVPTEVADKPLDPNVTNANMTELTPEALAAATPAENGAAPAKEKEYDAF